MSTAVFRTGVAYEEALCECHLPRRGHGVLCRHSHHAIYQRHLHAAQLSTMSGRCLPMSTSLWWHVQARSSGQRRPTNAGGSIALIPRLHLMHTVGTSVIVRGRTSSVAGLKPGPMPAIPCMPARPPEITGLSDGSSASTWTPRRAGAEREMRWVCGTEGSQWLQTRCAVLLCTCA